MAISHIPIYYYRVRGLAVKIIPALHEKYGPVVRLAPNELSYIDAQAWKDIFGHRAGGKPSFPKDPAQYGPDLPGVKGILRSDDLAHSRQRRVFSHAFSDRALKEQESLIKMYVDLLIKTLSKLPAARKEQPDTTDGGVDMVKMYNFTTFDIMGDLTFGEPLNMLKDGEYIPWVENLFSGIKFISFGQAIRRFPLLASMYSLLLPKSWQEKRKQHLQFSADRVDRRMADMAERPDIWNQVIKNGGRQEISSGEMYSNAGTFMIAGTETTATLLSALTWMLCRNLEKMQKLVEEIRAFSSADELTVSNLQRLKYLHACLEEALRIHPPFPVATMRLVPEGGAAICGTFLPAGVCIPFAPISSRRESSASSHGLANKPLPLLQITVGIPHIAAYHSTTNFRDADKFVPERWIPGAAGNRYESDNKAVFQPFSFGPRNCLGKR
jgi:cytochrome P450